MPIAPLAAVGPMELVILGLSAMFWLVIITLAVSAIRFFRQRTDQDRTIATLVEENRRLREALGEKPSHSGLD